jgi:hypothetical protein
MVALGVVAIVGGVVFTLLNVGMTLYAQNVAINRTHAGGLISTERLLLDIAAASEAPALVNDTGATVTGNGPAAGIRYFSPASSRAYPVSSAVSAAAMSFAITKTATQPAPQAGDKLTMADLGFQGVITSVSGSGSSYTVGFASSVGSGFSPAKTSGTVIPAGSKGFVHSPSAVISVGSVLRRYPRAMSVAQNGSAAFNDTANFDQVTALLPIAAQTNCFPFQYLDPARRSVDVSLRIRAAAHGSGITPFYTFQNVKTTVAYRTASSL